MSIKMEDKLLTIFTPTYNRGYRLPELYASLCRQTNPSFVWLIVDDGSTDGTEEVVRKWRSEKKAEIVYLRQSNQGKSAAHNVGVQNTKTPLFLCVDSDDYLTDNAVEEISAVWKKCRPGTVGVIALRSVTRRGTHFSSERVPYTTLRDLYRKRILIWDTMLVYRTDIISKYQFPKFSGEKFVPEAYLYDRIDQDGKMRLLDQTLYMAEYLEDGYTRNMNQLIKDNPNGYLAYITQRLKMDEAWTERFMDSARYIAVAMTEGNFHIIRKAVYPLIAFLAFPIGLFVYVKKYR